MKGIPLSMDSDMVRSRVRSNMEVLKMSQKEYAEMSGYSEQYLCDFLAGRREPGKKILDAENLKAVVYYEHKDLP